MSYYLIETKEVKPMFKKKDNKAEDHLDKIETVVLRTVNKNYELGVIKGILDENQIPYIIRVIYILGGINEKKDYLYTCSTSNDCHPICWL